LDTGLFLDHRPARRLIRGLAKGKHFLNLFCYTGSATVHAALGGARSTMSVDMSQVYLDWLRRNLARNGFSEQQHRTERADCRDWLAKNKRRYDLIFLDPPTFSNSKRMQGTLDIQRDHVELLLLAATALNRAGVLIFSTNQRGFKLDKAALSAFEIQDVASIDPDFERNAKIHQCWRIEQRRC
jgi:23S rRNA (guanine2445-N2)-methyltransferase / 23S rRNA (guanine2069-N7)-methyltransferase